MHEFIKTNTSTFWTLANSNDYEKTEICNIMLKNERLRLVQMFYHRCPKFLSRVLRGIFNGE